MAVTVVLLLTTSLSGCLDPESSNKPPQAFAGVDIEAEVGEDVVFSGTGLDEDGSVVYFRWDYYGDGTWDYEGDTGARLHRYTRPGEYETVLQVEDDEGAKAEDRRWVNVTASIQITVDWVDGTGFQVHIPQGLDVSNMEVDWDLVNSGDTPLGRTFTHDAGLEKVNDTTYAVDPGLGLIEGGQRHVVKVRLGQIVSATRTIDVVETPDTVVSYKALYEATLWDHREFGNNWTDLWRSGDLAVDWTSGRFSARFEGEGNWTTHTNVSGVISNQSVHLTLVVVDMGREGLWDIDFWRQLGNGSIEQWDPLGFYIFAFVKDFERTADNGSLAKDDWRRVGVYRAQNETNGTFEWTRVTLGNQVRQNGNEELIEVLKVHSVKDFDGTNKGLNFTLNNVTFEYDASRLIFENRTIFRQADQQVAVQQSDGRWVWANTSWSGFVDQNGDEDFNPDPIGFDPEAAAEFTGPRPRVLHVGDAFTATDLYGVSLEYTAKRADSAPLETPTGTMNVTGVLAEAIYNTTWGKVLHWFWVLEDGPLPGFVYEERILMEASTYGGGTYDWYRNVASVEPLT